MTRVVIVDDASDLRVVLALAMRRDGRLELVADVGDGRAGVAAVEEYDPDIVLMDVSMPIMDGLSATRQIKAARPHLPVVIFTGYGDDRLSAEALACGADAFLEKTTPLPQLFDELVRLAERR